MAAVSKRVLELETEWLRGYASSFSQDETGFTFSDDMLSETRTNLVEIRNAFRRCVVVFADKLDEPGALWIAEGPTDEDEQLRLTLKVVSATGNVRLMGVERFSVASPDADTRRDGPDEAA